MNGDRIISCSCILGSGSLCRFLSNVVLVRCWKGCFQLMWGDVRPTLGRSGDRPSGFFGEALAGLLSIIVGRRTSYRWAINGSPLIDRPGFLVRRLERLLSIVVGRRTSYLWAINGSPLRMMGRRLSYRWAINGSPLRMMGRRPSYRWAINGSALRMM